MKVNLLFFCGLLWLFVACEREVPVGGSGELVAVRFSVQGSGFGAGSGLRGEAVGPEAVRVPVAGDLVVEATLRPVPGVATRDDGDGFALGTKLWIAAYASTSGVPAATATASALYEVKEAAGVRSVDPVSVGGDLAVPAGDYVFAAWAENTPVAPLGIGDLATTSFNPLTTDLLWGRSAETAISGASSAVSILLQHHFSQVAIYMEYGPNNGNTDPNYFTLSGDVAFSPNYAATLTAYSGALAKAGGALTTEVSMDRTGVKTRYCDPFLVYTAGEAISVEIPSATLVPDNLTLTDLVIPFTQSLQQGVSYELSIRLRDPPVKWAGSNVYWDPTLNNNQGGLTFARYGDPDKSKQYYQGVFFRWGSLVGISPVGTFDAGTNGSPTTGTTLYVYHNNQWIPTNAATAYAESYPGFTGDSWTDLPVSAGTGTPDFTADNLDGSFPDNTGDICRYIGSHGGPSGYRMPKGSEFGLSSSSDYAWGPDTDAVNWYLSPTYPSVGIPSTDPTGQQPYGSTSTNGGYATNYGSKFPSAGKDNSSGGEGAGAGLGGNYWSCSSGGTDFIHSLLYRYDKGLFMVSLTKMGYAFPVRCLRSQQ